MYTAPTVRLTRIRLLTATAAVCLLALTPAASHAEDVSLVKNGRTSWVVSVASTNSPGTKWAAAELQRYVKQISGDAPAFSQKSGGSPAIVIGLRKDLSETDRALLPPAAKGSDGYAIAIRAEAGKSPARIIIAGDNGPGVIYGAYDFLERLGCRWFYPTEDSNDPEVVPKQKNLTLSAASWAVASPMKYRICNGSGWFFEMEAKEAVAQLDWAMKNRYNLMGWQAEASPSKHSLAWQYQRLRDIGVLAELEKRELAIHGPAHCFDQLLLSEDYFDKHPEWFGFRQGKRLKQAAFGSQFCWSNRDARKQFIANAEAFITNAPLIKIFAPIPFDGGQACECDNCKKTGASNALMILMGELVERLKISRPEVLVESIGGYGAAIEPPTQTNIIHPDLRVVWAHWGRPHSMGYDDPRYAWRDKLDKWRVAAHGQITICQYYTDNFCQPWVMSPFAVAVEGDRKYFLQHKVDAFYMLMWPRGYWWNHGLNAYLGRCFYDVSLNPYEVIRDYAQTYFGPDAGPLVGAYLEEWAREPELCYWTRGGGTAADRAKLAEQRKNYLEPAIKAVANDKLLSYRVSKLEKLHTTAEKLYELHRQRELVTVARKAGKFSDAKSRLEETRAYTGDLMKFFSSLAELNQGLMDRDEVAGFIKLALNNWLDEETKAISARKRN